LGCFVLFVFDFLVFFFFFFNDTATTEIYTLSLHDALPICLKSGKVSPVAALIHHKLPDQSQVRRIFKEVESRGERIELNLYIVGEDAEEEEGVMAEGGQES